jgi:hypothetical protein
MSLQHHWLTMRLFISYARANKDRVYALVDRLETALSAHVWIDRLLKGGDHWWDEILNGIEACDCFVLILTPQSLASIYCRAEWTYALALGKPVLPLKLESFADSELPEPLAAINYCDLRTFPEGDWLSPCQEAITRLSNSQQPKLSSPRPSVPTPRTPEEASEAYAIAVAAHAEGKYSLAAQIFEQIKRLDDPRFQADASRHLAAIHWEAARGKEYDALKTLAENPATRGEAKHAWEIYLEKYGSYDPDRLIGRFFSLPYGLSSDYFGMLAFVAALVVSFGGLLIAHISAGTPFAPDLGALLRLAPGAYYPDLNGVFFDALLLPASFATLAFLYHYVRQNLLLYPNSKAKHIQQLALIAASLGLAVVMVALFFQPRVAAYGLPPALHIGAVLASGAGIFCIAGMAFLALHTAWVVVPPIQDNLAESRPRVTVALVLTFLYVVVLLASQMLGVWAASDYQDIPIAERLVTTLIGGIAIVGLLLASLGRIKLPEAISFNTLYSPAERRFVIVPLLLLLLIVVFALLMAGQTYINAG